MSVRTIPTIAVFMNVKSFWNFDLQSVEQFKEMKKKSTVNEGHRISQLST